MPETVNAEKTAVLESRLEQLLTPKEKAGKAIYEAMAYSTLNGGKRVRAMLAFLFCQAVPGDGDWLKVLDYAAAVEMIHAASLIHDDLPAMDNDDFRRGKPSNHKVYGEAGAILAGDGLIIKAFEVAASNPFCTPAQNMKAVGILASRTGADGMTAGQMLDIYGDESKIDGETLKTLHTLKTSCLISAACMLGCVAAGGSEIQQKAAEEFGICLGLAFQIKDDILDIEGDFEKMGKTPGKDAKENKATYPALFGLEKSRKMCGELTERAVAALSEFGDSAAAEELKNLAFRLLDRKF